jgi:hypothetical protein
LCDGFSFNEIYEYSSTIIQKKVQKEYFNRKFDYKVAFVVAFAVVKVGEQGDFEEFSAHLAVVHAWKKGLYLPFTIT